MDGDREDDAEPSPVLGITGKRLLSLRLTGAGLGGSNDELSLGTISLIPSRYEI